MREEVLKYQYVINMTQPHAMCAWLQSLYEPHPLYRASAVLLLGQ